LRELRSLLGEPYAKEAQFGAKNPDRRSVGVRSVAGSAINLGFLLRTLRKGRKHQRIARLRFASRDALGTLEAGIVVFLQGEGE
jgi:hypothetical protein